MKKLVTIHDLFEVADVMVCHSTGCIDESLFLGGKPKSIIFLPDGSVDHRHMVKAGMVLGVYKEEGLAKAISTIELFEDELREGRHAFMGFEADNHRIDWDVNWEEVDGEMRPC